MVQTRAPRAISGALLAAALLAIAPVAPAAAGNPPTGPGFVTGDVWTLRAGPGEDADVVTLRFGRATDLPVMGDWDGNGVASPGIFRDGRWLLRNELTTGGAEVSKTFGAAGDKPVVGDWDGDGDDDLGVVRDDLWLEDLNLTGGHSERKFRFGLATDVPVAGNWDGAADGSAADEPGVFRAGVWHLTGDPAPTRAKWSFRFGSSGDAPVVGRWQRRATHDQVGYVRNGRWHVRHALDDGAADRSFSYGSKRSWHLTTGAGGTSVRQQQVHYTYTVGKKGTVRSSGRLFAQVVREALGNSRGWSLGRDIRFSRVDRSAPLHVWLAAPAVVDAADPVCSANWSCRVGSDVYINERRWVSGTATWRDRQRYDYRRYVLNHEVGHWLGMGHARCSGAGAPAPVMLQQSKTLDGCKANLWPLRREIAAARARHVG